MKRLKKLFILFCISILLTGCVKYNITIDLSDGESIYLESTLLIKEKDLKSYDLTIQSLKKQLKTNSDFLKDWKVEETSDTINNEEYKGLIFTAPDTVNKQLAKNFSSHEVKDITTYELDINFIKNGIDISELKSYKSTLSVLKANHASFEMIIKMPGQITKSSLGNIDHDTVTIDMYEYFVSGGIPDLNITSQEKSIDPHFYLYFIVGIVIIALLIIVSYLTKRKRKKDI